MSDVRLRLETVLASPGNKELLDEVRARATEIIEHPGDLRDYYHAAIRPEGRLHFSGEHCSLDQGWMQGAVMSGLRAVEELVSR